MVAGFPFYRLCPVGFIVIEHHERHTNTCLGNINSLKIAHNDHIKKAGQEATMQFQNPNMRLPPPASLTPKKVMLQELLLSSMLLQEVFSAAPLPSPRTSVSRCRPEMCACCLLHHVLPLLQIHSSQPEATPEFVKLTQAPSIPLCSH